MSIDYAKIAAKSQDLITKSGRTITLVKPVSELIDTSKPWNGPVADATPPDATKETRLVIPGVQVIPNAVRVFGLSALGAGSEFRGLITYSELVYIVFQGEEPLEDYTFVRDNGIDYGIQAVQSLKPADVTLLGFIGVRR